jgi:hypothetical protein
MWFFEETLPLMSQVTYCAGRLQQEPESAIVPITARYLIREVSEMRQWSPEGKDWELDRKHRPKIDWVRDNADDVIIDSNETMTEVTAEAWRIAAIICYQCRFLRYEYVKGKKLKGRGRSGPTERKLEGDDGR